MDLPLIRSYLLRTHGQSLDFWSVLNFTKFIHLKMSAGLSCLYGFEPRILLKLLTPLFRSPLVQSQCRQDFSWKLDHPRPCKLTQTRRGSLDSRWNLPTSKYQGVLDKNVGIIFRWHDKICLIARTPFPFTWVRPRWSILKWPRVSRRSFVSLDICIRRASIENKDHQFFPLFCLFYLRNPVDCILEAVLTVSPTRQYLGMTAPTTPVTTGPVWIPLRIWSVSPGLIKSTEKIS